MKELASTSGESIQQIISNSTADLPTSVQLPGMALLRRTIQRSRRQATQPTQNWDSNISTQYEQIIPQQTVWYIQENDTIPQAMII